LLGSWRPAASGQVSDSYPGKWLMTPIMLRITVSAQRRCAWNVMLLPRRMVSPGDHADSHPRGQRSSAARMQDVLLREYAMGG